MFLNEIKEPLRVTILQASISSMSNEAIPFNGGSSKPSINNKIIDQLINRSGDRFSRWKWMMVQVYGRVARGPFHRAGFNIVHGFASKLPLVLSAIFLVHRVEVHSPLVSFSSGVEFTVTKARATALNLAREQAPKRGVGEGRRGKDRKVQPYGVSTLCPRLVILHCSSTSIFKSAPPPPCPFFPATSSFYHLFVR